MPPDPQIAAKLTVQGFLIYLTMSLYFAAFVTALARVRKTGRYLFLAGFAAAIASYVYRWFYTGHVPMQNLFEVFLTLGLLIYPISILSRRYLKVGGAAFDMLLGVIILFPAGFIFSAEPKLLPPALQSWLFVPHVAVYMISYIIMAKAVFQACARIGGFSPKAGAPLVAPEEGTYRMVCVGFPFLTLGLVLGSLWAQEAWGSFWGWDPKEMWSLVTWLLFLGYLHFRYMFGQKYSTVNSIWVVAGFLAILITLLWANLSKLFPGLHSYAS